MADLGKRVFYGGAVHDEAEIEAVLGVLRGGGQALKLGPNVEAMENKVAALFGKSKGLMVNSGSSALFTAVELLDLPPGSEVISSPVAFSTDLTPLMKAGLVPAFVDVEYDTFQADPDAIEEMITPKTRAILLPNLAGNGPDWDKVRAVADRHDLKVIEDSCDALAPTLRGTPTGLRSDISVTSFAISHIITCAGNGGMVMMNEEALRDRGLMLRRWGRRSEVQNYGSQRGERNFRQPVDGVDYDSLFIFDDVGWNFEPSELGAAYGLQQLEKVEHFRARRQRINALYLEIFERHPDVFIPPRFTDGMDTVWMSVVAMLRPECGFTRSEFQEAVELHGIDSRTVWTGNAVRQPFLKNVPYRVPSGGLPNADRVFEHGITMPASHGLSDEDVLFVGEVIDDFIAGTR